MKKGVVTLITLALLLGGVMPLHAQGDKAPVLFEADFNDSTEVPGEILLFQGIQGAVVDGALQISSGDSWGGFDLGTVWSDDYMVETRVNITSGDEFDIYVRNQSTDYICAYGVWAPADGSLETGAWIGDNCDEGSEWTRYSLGVSVPRQEWFTLRLTVTGSTFSVAFNGEDVFSIDDNLYDTGRITASISPNSVVLVDDLVVYDLSQSSGASQLGAFMRSRLVLEETFDDAQLEPGIDADIMGEVVDGAWHFSPQEQAFYIQLDQVLADYALELKFKVVSGNGIDVNIRTQDANYFCSYVYWLDGDTLRLGRWISEDCDQDSTLDNMVGRTIQYPRNEWVTMRMQAIGNIVSVYLDGSLMLSIKDDTYSQGISWLAIWQDSEVYIDNLRLYDLQ